MIFEKIFVRKKTAFDIKEESEIVAGKFRQIF